MRLLAGLPLLILGTLLTVWLASHDGAALRAQLTHWQFWMLEVQCVLFVVLCALNLGRFLRSLRLSVAWHWTAASAVLLTLVLTGAVAPRTNRIFFDEHIYQGIAQNLSDLHLAQMCNDGTVEYGSLQCWRGEYYKEPYGYPYVLSIGYRIFGVQERLAHVFNVLCAGALTWVIFLLGCALYADPRAGAYAAFVLAFIPQQLLWSHTAAVEPSTAFMCAVAVLTAVHYVRERSTASLLWMVVTTVFAAQFRPEAGLVVPLAGLIVLAHAPGEFARARFWLVAALGLALGALHAGHLVAVHDEPWGATGAAMALQYVWPNLKVNGLYYLDNVRFPVVFTALAVVALMARPIRTAGLLAVWFLLFWGIFLPFYAGSYNYGADVRYSLMSYAPLALLAGRGATWLHASIERLGLDRRRAWQVVGLLLCVPFLEFLPQVRAVGEEAWGARADVAFAQRVIPELPKNSIVLTHNPAIFHLNGVSAAQMSLAATDPTYAGAQKGRYAGGIFLHWSSWCNYDDVVQKGFCGETLRLYPGELFREYQERDFTFAFYRLKPTELIFRGTLKRIPAV